jgi:hypothetical protein
VWRLVLVATVTACNSLFGIHDLPRDGDAQTGDARDCFGRGALVVCLTARPTAPVSLPTDVDTDSSLCEVDDIAGTPCCVLAGTSIATTADVRAHGSRPLVLVATGDLHVDHVLDASSHAGAPNGPAADMCVSGSGSTGGGSVGGGGGGGGSFGSSGGAGGNGQGGATPAGTAAAPATPPTVLRGGCAGGAGGNGNNTSGSGGAGGAGGGVVYLVAGGTISIDGTVNASGAGGGGGDVNKGGGAGGGAGGMIVIDGAALAGAGAVFANGGGGGGGADMGTRGGTGGESSAPALAGTGGIGSGSQSPPPACGSGPGCGGNGAAGTLGAQQGGQDVTGAGGGGGGGGLGYVLLPPELSFATVSGVLSRSW